MSFQSSAQLRLYILGSFILVALCVNSWFLYKNFKNVGDREALVVHTYDVMNSLDVLLSSVKDAETGLRGYILTGQDEFLQPYIKGRMETTEHVSRLKVLTGDNPNQQINLDVLAQTVKRRFDILQALQEEFSQKNRRAKMLDAHFTDGKVIMDSVREQISKMKLNETELLKSRTLESARSKEFFYWSLIGTTLISVFIIGITFVQIGKNQRRAQNEAREKDITAHVSQLISGDISLEKAGQNVLEFISQRFGVLAGRLFMLENRKLLPVTSYGLKITDPEKDAQLAKNTESTLLNSALSRKEVWEIKDIPENYWHISTSLGESIPKTLTLVPIVFQNQAIGIFELAAFDKLSEDSRNLLAKLIPVIGVGLNAAQSRGFLQNLLEKTQIQSEELQSQQEELKTNNEELEQQARALEAQQSSLSKKNKELETAQTELQAKAGQLEKSSQYKSDFLAKMSHELRTPLNGLLILSTLLIENKERNMTDQQRGFARSIYNAGNDLLVLINDILDLSKIEARKLKLRPDIFTLGSLFESKRLTFEPQTNAKSLKLNIELTDEMKTLKLNTDRQRLEQILRNFLSNAIKFTDAGTITLRAEVDKSQKWITFIVEDTGIGIPKNKQKVIFDAFEQADSSVSRQYGGTGLGLTISRELAALLGGKITLVSDEGKGSQFNLQIPIELEDTSTTSAFEPKPTIESTRDTADPEINTSPELQTDRVRRGVKSALQDLNTKKKTILVVEDDDTFRTSVIEMIRSYNFEAIEASDGEVALAILNEHTPDAILLDIKLSGISGLGILESIKHLPHLRHVPVHMISAMEYQHNALRMGALGYLTKPVTTEKIRAALSRIENMISTNLRRVLLIEDDERQSKAITELISGKEIEVVSVRTGEQALEKIKTTGFDCIILDLTLPDVSGVEVLSELSKLEISVPPVVIYTGKDLTEAEEEGLRKYSESIVIKGARSPERLLDEVNLFLHRVESLLPSDKREMLIQLRSQVKSFEGKTVLVVDDDIRNVFALTSALEAKGLQVRVARNGVEALDALDKYLDIDLVLMDIMMPKMDGFEAMRHIRKNSDTRIRDIPIVALTAKAMREDHEKCMDAGASDYLPKPVNLNNLTTVLKVWLTPKGFMG